MHAVLQMDDDAAPHCTLEKEFNEILKQTLNVNIV